MSAAPLTLLSVRLELAMTGGDKRTDELSELADRIEQFDQARSQRSPIRPHRERPERPPISPRERKMRQWLFAAIAAWGGFVFALIVIQGWGRLSPWELALAAPIVILCVLGCYGFHLFYADLGKRAVRMVRSRKRNDSGDAPLG